MTETAKTKNSSAKSVLRRIKYLVLIQAGEKFRLLKTGDKKKTAFKIFLSVLAAIAVTFGLFYLFNLIKSKFSFTFDYKLFTTVIFLTQVISIITCTGGIMAVLYNGKEQ